MKQKIVSHMLSPNLGPIVYIFAMASLVTGVFFIVPELAEDVSNTVLYSNGVFLGLQYWGTMMLLSALAALIGMVLDKRKVVKYASFYQALLWFFASMTYAEVGNWFSFLAVGVAHVLVWSYIYLTACWFNKP